MTATTTSAVRLLRALPSLLLLILSRSTGAAWGNSPNYHHSRPAFDTRQVQKYQMTPEKVNDPTLPTRSEVSSHVFVVGVMGGIGSGKSTACQMLVSELIAPGKGLYLEADSIARGLYQPKSPVIQVLQQEFGPSIVLENGEINKANLAGIIFADPEARQRLEQIVWPLTKQEVSNQIDQAARDWQLQQSTDHDIGDDGERINTPIVVLEAAMLLDAGWEDMLDALWVITASKEAAFQRLVKGERALPADDVERRMEDQKVRRGMGNLDEEVKQGIVTAVVDNSGTTEALQQALSTTLKEAVENWKKPPPSS